MSGPGEDDVWRLPSTVKTADVRLSSGGSGKRRSPSLSSSAKARLTRIVNKTPEAMVKLTGRTRGRGHLKKHLDYITRHAKLTAIDQDGRLISDKTKLRGLHDDWLLDNKAQGAQVRDDSKLAQSVSLVLSMPPGTPPDRVEQAAMTWAQQTFKGTHDWIAVRHNDTAHPHVHVTVRAVGYDGKRLAPGPADLQAWRDRFARELRSLGVPAEATPRQARGVIPRSDRPAIHRMEKRGQTPHVRHYQQRDATIASRKVRVEPKRDYAADIQARQTNIQRAYLVRAEELASGDAADRQLAKDIVRFVQQMPVAKTRRDALADELRAVTKQHPGRDAPPLDRIQNRPPKAPQDGPQQTVKPVPEQTQSPTKGPRR